MGGHSDLSLSSHTRDDQQYNAKRDELRQYIPDLEHHLRTLSIIIFSLFFSKHSLSLKSSFQKDQEATHGSNAACFQYWRSCTRL